MPLTAWLASLMGPRLDPRLDILVNCELQHLSNLMRSVNLAISDLGTFANECEHFEARD